jgi:acetoacetyl-CoA synthetase
VTERAAHGPIWAPTPAQRSATRLHAFLAALRARGVVGPEVADAHALQRWSVEHLETFWAEVWRAADVLADGPGPSDAPWAQVLMGGDRMAPPDATLGPRWFTGTRLNSCADAMRRPRSWRGTNTGQGSA